jgi:hypothetical protein
VICSTPLEVLTNSSQSKADCGKHRSERVSGRYLTVQETPLKPDFWKQVNKPVFGVLYGRKIKGFMRAISRKSLEPLWCNGERSEIWNRPDEYILGFGEKIGREMVFDSKTTLFF